MGIIKAPTTHNKLFLVESSLDRILQKLIEIHHASYLPEVRERLVQLSKNLQLSSDRMRNDSIAGHWPVVTRMTRKAILGSL